MTKTKRKGKPMPDDLKPMFIAAGGQPDNPRIGARCQGCDIQNYTVGYWDDHTMMLEDYMEHDHPREALKTCDLFNRLENKDGRVGRYEVVRLELWNGRLLCQHCISLEESGGKYGRRRKDA